MNRDEVRDLISRCGIDHINVTREELLKLRKLLNKHLKASGIYSGSAKLNRIGGNIMYMSIQTNQWPSREAVSFNADGFIGFAGWADNTNVKPVLAAVVEWAQTVSWERASTKCDHTETQPC